MFGQQGASSPPSESNTIASSTDAPATTEESVPDASGYRFLVECGLSTAQLLEVVDLARRWGVSVSAALVASGAMDERTYAQLVAAALGVAAVEAIEVAREPALFRLGRFEVRRLIGPVGQPVYALAATAGPLDVLVDAQRAVTALGGNVVVAPPSALATAIERADRSLAIRRAVLGLRRIDPDLSASRPPAHWQLLAFSIAIGLFVGGFVVMPALTLVVLLALLTLPFLAVVVIRSAALRILWRPALPAVRSSEPLPIADVDLPVYSVLVPLFNEADVVSGLVDALAAFDYPSPKLDIVLVLEEVDLTTKLALLRQPLPANFRIMVVPECQPRTKPKAVNYAMQFARGDYVVVYDAEDRPEADQLRKAVQAFRDGPPRLACVQARLNLYNPRDSWFSRQFTLEYSALFDAILPALAWLGLPIPLGGTSNHFPRAVLENVGGWDPFNVTEDADLGIRLARLGYEIEMLDSTTWEEAPIRWSQWLPQRTRWLKGWYQTYTLRC